MRVDWVNINNIKELKFRVEDHPPIINTPSGLSVLDYGCGYGRSAKFLRTKFKTVDGFDLSNILTLMTKEQKAQYNQLFSDINGISKTRYNCVYAQRVLQHIDIDELIKIVPIISSICDKLIIGSRWWIDEDRSPMLFWLIESFSIENIYIYRDKGKDKKKLNGPREYSILCSGRGLNADTHFDALLVPRNHK